jgi:hypothetical protein
LFNINGYRIKEGNEYLQHPRTKVTTTIRSDYYDEYKKLMNAVGEEYCKGFDIMLELLSEDEELLDKFILKVKKY